jgi:plasmid stabilization system protein ParE
VADLRLSAQALASLRSHDAWLRERDPSAADRFRAEVDRTLGLLSDFPKLGHPIQGTRSRAHVTRRYRYRIIYRHIGNEVLILDVLHPRQSGPA